MSTYGQLIAQIKRDIRRDDLDSDTATNITDTTIQSAIKDAIAKYQSHAFWFLKTSTTSLSATSGAETISLPSDFVAPLHFRLTGTNSRWLELTNYTEIELMRSDLLDQVASRPIFYALYGNNIELYPTPSQSYTTKLSYIYRLPELTNDADANGWTRDYEGGRLVKIAAEANIWRDRLRNFKVSQELEKQEGVELARVLEESRKREATGKIRREFWT